MYKAQSLRDSLSGNKYSFDSEKEIDFWIKSQDKSFRDELLNLYNYGRVRALFEFEKLSKLEKFLKIESLCVVSGGGKDEPEQKFIKSNSIFSTTLEDGFDLTEDWRQNSGFEDIIESFDFVMCNQVLEHVPDVLLAFKNLVSLTKPGGYIWVSLPVINRIHMDPDFYSSGYHPRFLKFLGDKNDLENVHISAWGSLKCKVFTTTRSWPTYMQLKRGIRSKNDIIFPMGVILNGLKNNDKHLVDAWALYKKPTK